MVFPLNRRARHRRRHPELDGRAIGSFDAYGAGVQGIHVASADVNGDGCGDILTRPNFGAAAQVKIFSGADASLLGSFYAYPQWSLSGGRLGAGDLNGDGRADIVVTPGPGLIRHVKVFDGATLSVLDVFQPFQGFGGSFVAVGDVTADGQAETKGDGARYDEFT